MDVLNSNTVAFFLLCVNAVLGYVVWRKVGKSGEALDALSTEVANLKRTVIGNSIEQGRLLGRTEMLQEHEKAKGLAAIAREAVARDQIAIQTSPPAIVIKDGGLPTVIAPVTVLPPDTVAVAQE